MRHHALQVSLQIFRVSPHASQPCRATPPRRRAFLPRAQPGPAAMRPCLPLAAAAELCVCEGSSSHADLRSPGRGQGPRDSATRRGAHLGCSAEPGAIKRRWNSHRKSQSPQEAERRPEEPTYLSYLSSTQLLTETLFCKISALERAEYGLKNHAAKTSGLKSYALKEPSYPAAPV